MKIYSLNRAAYLKYFGAKVIHTYGTLDNQIIEMDVPQKALQAEKQKIPIWYKTYMGFREEIKRRCRKDRGLPEQYHKNKPFTFLDIAHL